MNRKRQIIGTTAATLAFLSCITLHDFRPAQANVGFGNAIVKGITTNYDDRPDQKIGFMFFIGVGSFIAIVKGASNAKRR